MSDRARTLTPYGAQTAPRRAGGFPALWGSADAKWPTSIRISICGTGVKGPLPPSMTSGNLRLFATRSPTVSSGCGVGGWGGWG